MAIIYGNPDTEKRLLDKLPKEIKSIDDISKVHKKFREDLKAIPDKGIINKFSRWSKKRQIKKIYNGQNAPLHSGAKGDYEF